MARTKLANKNVSATSNLIRSAANTNTMKLRFARVSRRGRGRGAQVNDVPRLGPPPRAPQPSPEPVPGQPCSLPPSLSSVQRDTVLAYLPNILVRLHSAREKVAHSSLARATLARTVKAGRGYWGYQPPGFIYIIESNFDN